MPSLLELAAIDPAGRPIGRFNGDGTFDASGGWFSRNP
jgi:hypothetical protein